MVTFSRKSFMMSMMMVISAIILISMIGGSDGIPRKDHDAACVGKMEVCTSDGVACCEGTCQETDDQGFRCIHGKYHKGWAKESKNQRANEGHVVAEE